MIRTCCLSAALAALLASPAAAEDPAPQSAPQSAPPPALAPVAKGAGGGVAQLALAQDLFALARAQKDPLLMVAAASLAGGVDLRAVDRQPETAGEPAPNPPDEVSTPPDAAAMFKAAQALATEDDLLATLLDEARSGTALARRAGLRASGATIAPGQTHSWRLPFDGGTLAELAVLGDGDANLDVTLSDAEGALLCTERGPEDRARCDFAPAETGFFTLTVTSLGPGVDRYLLVTN